MILILIKVLKVCHPQAPEKIYLTTPQVTITLKH